MVPGTLENTDGTAPGEEPVPDDLVVTKTVDDAKYALGAEITFQINATNIYNEERTITLSEIEGVTLAQSVFEDVPAGETVTTTATYTVTEADILAGSFINTVTAMVGNITKTASATANIADPNGHLTITKESTSTPTDDSGYMLDETITYTITVKNDGNLTITDITVTDELTGDEWKIASLAPDESEVYETSYTVTEADVLAGKVVNVATAEGTSPDPDEPKVPVEPGEDTEPTSEESILTVDSDSLKVKYDGKVHTVIATSNLEDVTIEYSINNGVTWSETAPSLTDVDVITFSVRAIKEGSKIIQKDGFKLEVTPRKITMTSASAYKWYDGTPLQNNSVTLSGDGFVEGEGATYYVIGSRTQVGTSNNFFTYRLKENTKAKNYRITVVLGKLTILLELEPNAPLAGYLGSQFGECFE